MTRARKGRGAGRTEGSGGVWEGNIERDKRHAREAGLGGLFRSIERLC